MGEANPTMRPLGSHLRRLAVAGRSLVFPMSASSKGKASPEPPLHEGFKDVGSVQGRFTHEGVARA